MQFNSPFNDQAVNPLQPNKKRGIVRSNFINRESNAREFYMFWGHNSANQGVKRPY